jgi:tRNA(fMet)-specific endonuclease VapC
VKAELLYGARHGTRVAENLRLLSRFFAAIPSVPFDDACAEDYGILRNELARAGRPIGPNDLLISATARARHLVLATRNVREFSRIPSLELEDWEA